MLPQYEGEPRSLFIAGRLTKRAELMLELVVDIKNNRKREGKKGGAAAVLSPTALKWLKQCRVEELQMAGLTWGKLLAPGKRGVWWLPTAAEQVRGCTAAV